MFDFDEKRPSEVPIVVLDTETTGLYPGLGHRIVEIGAVRLENWQVVAEVNQLIQPRRKMDISASAVNGIYDEDLVNQPTFLDIANNLLALLDGALLVAHNATFDAGFLGMELFINGYAGYAGYALENEKATPVLPNPWLCTLQLARRYFYFGQNNLANIANRLGVRMGRAHRALNDVYMTVEVLKRMVYQLSKQRLETIGDLLYAQGEPIYTPPPPRVFLPSLIANALANNRQLRILYLGKSGETERVISPYYATQHQGVSYLIAFCHRAREQRTFRLDRIFSAEEV